MQTPEYREQPSDQQLQNVGCREQSCKSHWWGQWRGRASSHRRQLPSGTWKSGVCPKPRCCQGIVWSLVVVVEMTHWVVFAPKAGIAIIYWQQPRPKLGTPVLQVRLLNKGMLVQPSQEQGTLSRDKHWLNTALGILMFSLKFDDFTVCKRMSGYLKMKAEETFVVIEW